MDSTAQIRMKERDPEEHEMNRMKGLEFLCLLNYNRVFSYSGWYLIAEFRCKPKPIGRLIRAKRQFI